MSGPVTAGVTPPTNEDPTNEERGGERGRRPSRSAWNTRLVLHVVVVVRWLAARVRTGHRAGGGRRGGEGARPGGDRPVVDVGVGVHVAAREDRVLRGGRCVRPLRRVGHARTGAR